MRRLAKLSGQSIAESERQTLLNIIVVLLTTTAILLTLTRPAGLQSAGRSGAAEISARQPSAPRMGLPVVLTPQLIRTARAFLTGYFAYLSGRLDASRIEDATGALLRSLQAHPPRVSPDMRAHTPRILSLRSTPAVAGLEGIVAVLNDGGLVNYQLGLLLRRHDSGLLVTGVEGQ